MIYLLSLKSVLNIVKKRLLHHVRDLVPFQRRAHEHERTHGRHDVVGRDVLLFLKEGFPFLLGWRGRDGGFPLGVAQGVGVITQIGVYSVVEIKSCVWGTYRVIGRESGASTLLVRTLLKLPEEGG